jgi:hypothetical protein
MKESDRKKGNEIGKNKDKINEQINFSNFVMCLRSLQKFAR